MRSYKSIFIASLALLGLSIVACVKDNTIVTPAYAEFATPGSVATGSYFITNDPNSVYMLPVGITTASSVARTINYTITSSTGAVAGQQYTVASNSIVIPAGKVVDSIPVKGIFAGYPTGRRDTLTFTLTGGDVDPFPSYNVFKLVTQKYCNVVSTDLTGNYTNTKDYDKTPTGTASTQKYTASISNWVPKTATSATITIKNLGASSDWGFGPFASNEPAAIGLTATLDWSNPANFTITLPSQPYMLTTFGYGPSTISGSGTFSSCDQTFTLTNTVKVSSGNFTPVATILKR
ncbi:MAG: hypothetical protein JWN76_85 [Chitinophagaceae bacterium]|nr:hypothetical protein [Chitinophagaceae bacterium]